MLWKAENQRMLVLLVEAFPQPVMLEIALVWRLNCFPSVQQLVYLIEDLAARPGSTEIQSAKQWVWDSCLFFPFYVKKPDLIEVGRNRTHPGPKAIRNSLFFEGMRLIWRDLAQPLDVYSLQLVGTIDTALARKIRPNQDVRKTPT